MELKLYDTLAREKRVFTPLDPTHVRMYVCGPTVYDFAHIGNARPVIVFDVLFRLLRHLYGADHVTYVRNITDVDDKINKRAAERLAARGQGDAGGGDLNAEIRKLTEETYANFKQDVAALGCLRPTVEPRATEFIRRSDGKLDMITLIERLIANGHAYAADGHVLFHVPSMPDYGRLSKRPLDEMIAGARVEVAPYKRDAQDFVLWKPSTPEEPGWDSPWGRGRPGWHIECSAMSGALLGETFDIHGGGIDLVFPHHENEIAQSRCAFHQPVMANYWMHNGFLMVEGEKMAKSLGNFITIREVLETESFGGRSWPGSVLRLAMLKTHYRQPIDWTVHALEEAERELQTWANALINTEGMYFSIGQRGLGNYPQPEAEIVDALADDLNAPKALAALRSIFSRLDKDRDAASVALMESCEFLGLLRAERLFEFNPYHVRHGANLLPMHLRHDLDEVQVAFANDREDRKNSLVAKLRSCGVNVMIRENGSLSYEVTEGVDVDQRVAARTAARARKDFKEADRIRDELLAMGVVLKDSKDPKTGEPVTTWEVAR